MNKNNKNNESKRYNMVYSNKLTARINVVQKEKGFKYRSDAITYLLNIALDVFDAKKDK